jgi:Mn2+/Fe2+ NRAMP family transporter
MSDLRSERVQKRVKQCSHPNNIRQGGIHAVKMLFLAAVLNGVLAPPLIVLVVLLTSNKKVMGKRVNPRVLTWLGWATAAIMAVAAIGMFATM